MGIQSYISDPPFTPLSSPILSATINCRIAEYIDEKGESLAFFEMVHVLRVFTHTVRQHPPCTWPHPSLPLSSYMFTVLACSLTYMTVCSPEASVWRQGVSWNLSAWSLLLREGRGWGESSSCTTGTYMYNNSLPFLLNDCWRTLTKCTSKCAGTSCHIMQMTACKCLWKRII